MTTEDDPEAGEQDGSLNEKDRLGFYVDLYKQSVETQQHFNDIEWRIRGLALTAATFVLGAAGLAAKDQTTIRGISLGAVVAVVGLVLWYAFYFVDRHWYHPLLRASVEHGTILEQEIQKSLPAAGMTQKITEGSKYRPGRVVRVLSGGAEVMRSDNKLTWFYKVGAVALAVVAAGLQLVATLSEDSDEVGSRSAAICIDFPQHGGAQQLVVCPSPSVRDSPVKPPGGHPSPSAS